MGKGRCVGAQSSERRALNPPVNFTGRFEACKRFQLFEGVAAMIGILRGRSFARRTAANALSAAVVAPYVAKLLRPLQQLTFSAFLLVNGCRTIRKPV